MNFYKEFQTGGRYKISKEEARKMIVDAYGERNADRHMKTLTEDGRFGLGYWNLEYSAA
jgi:hypothetical protein